MQVTSPVTDFAATTPAAISEPSFPVPGMSYPNGANSENDVTAPSLSSRRRQRAKQVTQRLWSQLQQNLNGTSQSVEPATQPAIPAAICSPVYPAPATMSNDAAPVQAQIDQPANDGATTVKTSHELNGGIGFSETVPADPWLFLDAAEFESVSQTCWSSYHLVAASTPFLDYGDAQREQGNDCGHEFVSSVDVGQRVVEAAADLSCCQRVSTIARGVIGCDYICDYLETFGKIKDLEDMYVVNGRDVELWCFEDASSAAAASQTLIHHATNGEGRIIELEIRRGPAEYGSQNV
jgi:hypothetical protein